MKKTLVFLIILGSFLVCFTLESPRGRAAQKKSVQPSGFDATIRKNSQQMMENGRHIFRYDTLGSEAFWGDASQLHRALAGAKNGGVGDGVSPKTARSPI